MTRPSNSPSWSPPGGTAGEVLRLWGDRVDEVRPKVKTALLDGMAEMAGDGDGGVFADSSTWAARARAPQ